MIRALDSAHTRRSLLLGSGLLGGLALAAGTAGLSWETGAVGLGFALAVLAGLAQRCSAWGYNEIFTIAPFVEGTETYRRWLQRATVYVIALATAGAVTGTLFAAAGAGASTLWPGMTLPLAVALGAVAFAYALHELDFVRLPVPGRYWQVPNGWLQGGFYRSAAIFGSLVGFGVLTRITFASLPILLAWLFISGNVLYGALIGLVYGAVRAISIYASATTQDAEEVVQLNQRLMTLAAPAHQLTGLFLAAFAAYLLAAPYLP